MDKINNDSLNIDGIFKNFYLVPDYQREYVWQNKNAEQLLQDVLDELITKSMDKWEEIIKKYNLI